MKKKSLLLLIIVLAVEFATAQSISISQKVDLGLSVCWAGYNVGALSPDDSGEIFAWGETYSSKNNDSPNSYQYGKGKECIDIGRNISATQYDVARVKWGGGWRMPTMSEWSELLKRCTWIHATYKDVNGYKVTGPNGNSIFLPVKELYEGGYWSSTQNEDYSYAAYCLSFSVIDKGCYISVVHRAVGFNVRPVCDSTDAVSCANEENIIDDVVENNVVHIRVESCPEFPGGDENLKKYISDNLRYPQESRDNNSQGRVVVHFVVDAEGVVCDVEVLQSSGDMYLDKEAVRLVSCMPKWKPGTVGGKPVDVQYKLPISFKLHYSD